MSQYFPWAKPLVNALPEPDPTSRAAAAEPRVEESEPRQVEPPPANAAEQRRVRDERMRTMRALTWNAWLRESAKHIEGL